ncbi:50S ribosomal protein L2 [Candidatus Gottesmanbacteria bacterium]|nr:50S ribosomal protein L2 [Candidatus Gottesmanbacteria bacterium]
MTGTTPGRRFMTGLSSRVITKKTPEKSLKVILPKISGRDVWGRVSVRHQGGRHKRFLRRIDFKRDKYDIVATVMAIEYDPNRSANIALLHYLDGEKRYILAPEGLKVGEKLQSAKQAEIKSGNSLSLSAIPVGTLIHNIELVPNRGGQLIRSAGSAAVVMAKEKNYVQVKMPSGEIRKLNDQCFATIGQVGNIEWKNIHFGKAGRKRHLGIRPTVRGTAQNPRSHPHGGGEGRSGVGMKYPKTPWGKHARGKKTRKRNKPSNKFIVQRRK